MLGIGALAQLARQHEGEDARHVGLIGDGQQVEHQPHVLFERVGHANRRVHLHVDAILRLGALDTPLDLAEVVQVVADAATIAHAQAALQLTASVATESSMLRSSRMRAARCAGLPACPNIRSNTTRGLMSIGSGVEGELHDTVFK